VIKMERYDKFVIKSCVRSVILYGIETWAMTTKKDILKGCDQRKLQYMAGGTWQDRLSSKKVAEICILKELQGKMVTVMVTVVVSHY